LAGSRRREGIYWRGARACPARSGHLQPRGLPPLPEALGADLPVLLDGEAGVPRVVVTDKLASYPPALKRVLPRTEHRRHKGLNNRAENAYRQVSTERSQQWREAVGLTPTV
jgi:DDE domain